MPGRLTGYDPDRILALQQRTIEAIAALRALTSTATGAASVEPAAAHAVQVAALARAHLEHTWMPLIGRILASEAMLTWSAATISGAGAGTGRSPATRPDAEVVTDFRRAAERLLAAVHGVGGDRDGAWRALGTVAAELGRRAAAAPRFAAAALATIGPDEVLSLLIGTRDMSPDWRASIVAPLARLVAAAATADAAVADWVRARARHHSVVGELLAARPRAFAPDLVVDVARTLIVADPTVADSPARLRASRALVAAVARHPDVALRLLGNADVLTAVAFDGRLHDHELTAAILEAGVGTALRRDPDALAATGGVLDALVTGAGRRRLTAGARRGLAVAIAPHLEHVNIHDLTGGGVVELSVGAHRTPPADGKVDYADLQATFGQLAADRDAQLLLTRAVAEHGDRVVAAAIATLTAGGSLEQATGSLGGYAAVVDVVLDGVDGANARLAIEHGRGQDRAGIVLTVLGVGAGLVPGAAGAVSSAGSRILAELNETRAPRSVDGAPVRQVLLDDVTVRFVEGLAATPELAARYGLARPPALAEQVASLAAAYWAADAPAARDAIASDLTSTLQAAGVLEAVTELHAESTLGTVVDR